ncbi:MAG TPA: TonB-dependent receptor [Flavisolibacter sp.]|nr:TonB-dependent receptor [Flavisolibacter sp.]
MRSFVFLAFALLFIFNSLEAQTHILKGKFLDKQAKTPLSGATILVKSTNSTISQTTVSDSTGNFQFLGLPADSFLLTISYIGYNLVKKGIKIDSSDLSITVNAVPNSSQDLETVIVTARISPVEQKGDTIQINASQYKVNPDASAEDLVKKMPGITVQNGQVTANGENVQKVTIDGRELFGDDATAALRNLPAEVIDKIQIFDKLSDQAQFTGFDDGNTTKSINIITKANMHNGQFGRVYAGYGTDNHYQAGGNATIFKGNERLSIVGLANDINQQNFSSQDILGVTNTSQKGGSGASRGGGQRGGNQGSFGNNGNFLVGQQGGINKTNSFGINYSDLWGPKITMTGSYFFNNTQNTTSQLSNTQYFSTKLPNRADTINSNSNNNNNRFNVRFEYKIDSFNQLIITPNLAFQNNQSDRTESTRSYFLPGKKVNETRNTTNTATKGNNLNNSILYRHAFHKKGRTFSLGFNTSYNDKNGDVFADGMQQFHDTTGAFLRDSSTRQHTIQANSGYQLSANAAYTEPLGKASQLQVNYNPSYSNSRADQEAYRYNATEQKYSLFDTSLSNKFTNDYFTQNAGVTFRHGNRDNMFSFGASYQHSELTSNRTFPNVLTVDKSFDNILPNAMARFKLSAHSNIRILYRVNVIQPSVTQLQDVYDITNLPFITAGNPELRPQYNQTISTRYTFTNTSKGIILVGNFFVTGANNYIASATYVPLRDSIIKKNVIISPGEQLTKPVNLNGYLNIRSYLTFAIPVSIIKSNINFNGGYTYNQLPGILNNETNTSKTSTYSIGSVIGSNISQYIDFTISYTANFNSVKNVSQPALNNSYFQHVASLSMNLLSKKGWFFQNDVTNQLYSGLSAGFNQNYTIWNMSAGRKFLKNQKGELKLSVFDLLKQNRSITRNITDTYIQDVQNQVLQQYFMLTFTYNLRNFGNAPVRPAGTRGNRNFNGGS